MERNVLIVHLCSTVVLYHVLNAQLEPSIMNLFTNVSHMLQISQLMDGMLTSPIKLNTTMKNQLQRRIRYFVVVINHSLMDKNVFHVQEITSMLIPRPVKIAQQDLLIGMRRENVFLTKVTH